MTVDFVTSWYAAAPDDDAEETAGSLRFELAEPVWVAVDGQKLLMPINPLEKDGATIEPDEDFGILTQYGGHGLLNQMLIRSDGDLEPESEWVIRRTEDNRSIHPVE
jgi:hypothetical protein